MAKIVVLGAGLGGTLMAYEMKAELGANDSLIVIGQGPRYHFVPSNPWVAAGWRERDEVEIDIAAVMARKAITYVGQGAKRVHPEKNAIELTDGTSVDYDYLVLATGPELAFDEIQGLGPGGFTQSICHIDHAEKAYEALEKLIANPGPIMVGAVQGASCFGPAYEFAFILDTELRKRRIRDKVPMTFVTSEPYIGHLGLDGVGDTKGLLESEMREPAHQMDHQRPGPSSRGRQDDGRGSRRGRGGEEDRRAAFRLCHDAAGLSRRRRGARRWKG